MNRGSNHSQIVLALSGGGFRAAMFHLGAMKRLHELGVLDRVDIISSVSGGSIIAALYCRLQAEGSFRFENLEQRLIDGIRSNVRARWVRQRVLRTVSDLLPRRRRRSRKRRNILEDILGRTFGFDITMQNLPKRPTLVINATGLHDGQAYHLGKDNPSFASVPLAKAVAASVAVPVVFEPVVVDMCVSETAPFPYGRTPPEGKLALIDGGVSENRGLQILSQLVDEDGGKGAESPRDTYIVVSDASRYVQPCASVPVVPGLFGTWHRLRAIENRAEVVRVNSKLDELRRLGAIAGYCGFTICDMLPIGEAWENTRYFLPSRFIDWAKEAARQDSPYELPMRLADWLAEVRTDLDAYDDLEIRCLMYQGYSNANSALLFGCWQILPDQLKEAAEQVLIHLSDPSAGLDRMEGAHFGPFLDMQNHLIASGEVRQEKAFPLPMTWREFNRHLESSGLVKKWRSLGSIENLNEPKQGEARIIEKAERHLSASSVCPILYRRIVRAVRRFRRHRSA